MNGPCRRRVCAPASTTEEYTASTGQQKLRQGAAAPSLLPLPPAARPVAAWPPAPPGLGRGLAPHPSEAGRGPRGAHQSLDQERLVSESRDSYGPVATQWGLIQRLSSDAACAERGGGGEEGGEADTKRGGGGGGGAPSAAICRRLGQGLGDPQGTCALGCGASAGLSNGPGGRKPPPPPVPPRGLSLLPDRCMTQLRVGPPGRTRKPSWSGGGRRLSATAVATTIGKQSRRARGVVRRWHRADRAGHSPTEPARLERTREADERSEGEG